MNGKPSRNGGSPTAALLFGVSFYALASYWPQIMGGTPNAADDVYTGFFKFIGAVSALGGLGGYYNAWKQREKRRRSEKVSGTFGEAAFATLEECREAGLLNPHGLYLGLLDGQPIFFSGKAHGLIVAPARSGKGVGSVTANALHCPGSMVATDLKGELAAMTAAHRRERFGQDVAIFNPWGLHGLPQHRVNPLENIIAIAGDPARQRGLTDEVKAIVMQLYALAYIDAFVEGGKSVRWAIETVSRILSPVLRMRPSSLENLRKKASAEKVLSSENRTRYKSVVSSWEEKYKQLETLVEQGAAPYSFVKIDPTDPRSKTLLWEMTALYDLRMFCDALGVIK